MALEVEETGNNGEKKTDLSSLEAIVREQQKTIEELKKMVVSNSANAQNMSIPGATLQSLIERIAVGSKQESEDLSAGVTMDKVPREDVLDEPVTYYAPLNGYVISGDMRNGIPVKLPWGKKSIFFDHYDSRIIQQGKYNEIAPLSIYRTRSKKEVEFLDAHTFNGIIFHKGRPKIKDSIEAARAARLSEILLNLKSLDLHDLFHRCNVEGIGVNDDNEAMRSALALKMLERETSNSERITLSRLNDADKERDLLNK